jgi:hypothetical protein
VTAVAVNDLKDNLIRTRRVESEIVEPRSCQFRDDEDVVTQILRRRPSFGQSCRSLGSQLAFGCCRFQLFELKLRLFEQLRLAFRAAAVAGSPACATLPGG